MRQQDEASEPLSVPPSMSSTSLESGASKKESHPTVKSSHGVVATHDGGRRSALPPWEDRRTRRETLGGTQTARSDETPRVIVMHPTPLAQGHPSNAVDWSSSLSTPMHPSSDDMASLASKHPSAKDEPWPSDAVTRQGIGERRVGSSEESQFSRRAEQSGASADVEDASTGGGTEWGVKGFFARRKEPEPDTSGDKNAWRASSASLDDRDTRKSPRAVPLNIGPSAQPRETRDDRRVEDSSLSDDRKKKSVGDSPKEKKKPASVRPSGREKAKAKLRAPIFQIPKHHRDNENTNAEELHYDHASDGWKRLRKEHFKDIPFMNIGPDAELARDPAFRLLRGRVDDLEGRVEQLSRMLAQAEAIAMDARRVAQEFESDRANDRYLRTLKMDDLERDVDILKIDVRTMESKQNHCSQRLQQLSIASKDVVDIAERRETQLQAIVEDTVGRLKTATVCAEKATKQIDEVEERLRAEMEAKYELEEKKARATLAELFNDLQITHDAQGQLARDVGMIKNLHVRTMEWELEIEDLDNAMMSPLFSMSGVRDMQLVLYPKGSKSHNSGSSLYVRAPLGSHFRFRLFVHHLGPANTANPPFISEELECVFDQENDRGCHTVGCFLFGQVVCALEFLENLTPGNPWMPVMRLVKPECHTTERRERPSATPHTSINEFTTRGEAQSRLESPAPLLGDAPQPNIGVPPDARAVEIAGRPKSPLQQSEPLYRPGSAREVSGISREHNVALKDPEACQESKLDKHVTEFREVLRERSTRFVDHVTKPSRDGDIFS